MASYTARFVKGPQVLSLAPGGRYTLGADFTPPATIESVWTAGGTSANRMGGAARVGSRAGNMALSFGVRVMGASMAECRKGVEDLAYFLRQAGEASALFFEWRDDGSLSIEPSWGQFGAPRRCEVVNGTLRYGGAYGVGRVRETVQMVVVSLEIKPYSYGTRQRVANALGGILEDGLGRADVRSQGVRIPGATTNKMTNPVYMASTWNSGWTAAASLLAQRNLDAQFALFGGVSAKLSSNAASNNTYTQSINVGNTNAHVLSCYARLPDGGAISTTQVDLYYGSAQTTTYTSIGNGWYRLSVAVTGVAAATAAGVVVKNGYAVYVDGFQLEEAAEISPLAYGDLLGVAWNSSAHASTSTRTAARLVLTNAVDGPYQAPLSIAEGSIALAWRTDYANTYATDLYLFDAGSIEGYFKASDDKFYLTDGTNTISSPAQTFAAGDLLHLVFVWGGGELGIYRDGASIASGGTYTPPASEIGTLYIGSDASTAKHCGGIIAGCTLYAAGLSSAEVLALYRQALQLTGDHQRVDWIPWAWTDGADGVVENSYDPSNNYTNWLVIGGVAGDVDADAEWLVTNSSLGTDNAFWLAVLPLREYTSDVLYVWEDFSGTATAGAVGGSMETITVGTSPVPTSNGPTVYMPEAAGQDYYAFLRLTDAGSNLLARARMDFNGDYGYTSDWKSLPADATARLFFLPAIATPAEHLFRPPFGANAGAFALGILNVDFKRSTGSADLKLDFIAMLPAARLTRVAEYANNTVGGRWRLNGRAAVIEATSSGQLAQVAVLSGAVPDLAPEKINFVMTFSADDGVAHTISRASTFTAIYVTPRWGTA